MNFGYGAGILVLQRERAGTGERAARWFDIALRIHRRDPRLRQILVLLVVALVIGLNAATLLSCQIFVQYVGVVVVPSAAANRDEHKHNRGWREPGKPRAF